jgi:hypothetical protein
MGFSLACAFLISSSKQKSIKDSTNTDTVPYCLGVGLGLGENLSRG